MKLNLLLAVLPLAALACDQDQESAPSATTQIRDSAGIRIVQNPRPPDGSRLPWRIGSEPAVSIGAVQGDEPYMLVGAIDATMLGDGRIVVANGGTSELRVFDATGIHVATWGGRGEGPGEFGGLHAVERWQGDSIIAWYTSQLGISAFDMQGNYGRTWELAQEGSVPLLLGFRAEHATRDGSILAIHMPESSDTVVVQLRDGEGRVRSSLGTHTVAEPYIHAPGTDQSLLLSKTLGHEPVWTPWGDLIVIGHTGRYELRAFAADGSLARIVRRDHVPGSPTPDQIEAYIEGQLAWTSDMAESRRARWRQGYESAPVAEHFPAFESVMSDATDHLWVAEYEFSTAARGTYDERPPRLWTVFDPEGRVLGHVETPEGLWIHEIGEDYILGLALDELNVEYVQVWTLERL